MNKFVKGALALTFVLGLTGCVSSSDEETSGISGKVTMNGSTSMQELVEAMQETIVEVYPDLEIAAEFTGSSSGVKAVIEGTAQIGNASRALKDEEKEKLTENIICQDGIAVIVSNDLNIKGITLDQLAAIYKGEITNWSEVGGDDLAIVVVGRDAASGTRGAFEEIVGVEDQCNYAQEIESTGAVVGKVEATPGTIGYVSLNVVEKNEKIKALDIDGASASAKNIVDGSYPIARPFVMATKGNIEEQSEEVQAIFDYLQSDEGQEVIENLGLISVK